MRLCYLDKRTELFSTFCHENFQTCGNVEELQNENLYYQLFTVLVSSPPICHLCHLTSVYPSSIHPSSVRQCILILDGFKVNGAFPTIYFSKHITN